MRLLVSSFKNKIFVGDSQHLFENELMNLVYLRHYQFLKKPRLKSIRIYKYLFSTNSFSISKVIVKKFEKYL